MFMRSCSAKVCVFAPLVVPLVRLREGVGALDVAFASVAIGFATVIVRQEGIRER